MGLVWFLEEQIWKGIDEYVSVQENAGVAKSHLSFASVPHTDKHVQISWWLAR